MKKKNLKGFTPTDVAHSLKQAREIAKDSYKDFYTKVVKSPRGEVYPYTIYSKPKRKSFPWY